MAKKVYKALDTLSDTELVVLLFGLTSVSAAVLVWSFGVIGDDLKKEVAKRLKEQGVYLTNVKA